MPGERSGSGAERPPLEDIRLDIHPPSGGCEPFGAEPWQRELRAFRGEMIYDNGRLPRFRLASGKFDDTDEHDDHAYHMVCRAPSTEEIIASARLAPAELLEPSRVMQMDEEVATRILESEGFRRSDVLEGARWIVDPRHRGRRIGKLLVVAANVLARHLHRKMIWVGAITAAGQDATLRRLGFHEASADEYVLPLVGDNVRVLFCRPEQVLQRDPALTAHIAPAVADALARIRLPEADAPAVPSVTSEAPDDSPA
ncbi:putative N-acetyltransferase YhbS [Streptosporangium becharense]|uniref:Putative N-acetyltransferase YhbS n=1 Tax=Streptosporangium becharense TaxID=1816182 RepID=A0A7W9IJZ2_9ACTN|nr:GNAT family N-acetyltransferase [Streptosporangium becharense]MBB2913899.1 putative N-acetyltransferase YhbS [Streptosporangium becharense]MBB5821439.1 putative N-acetyltransferase YhbS [Streptosporangium becharense]